jgi:hypothetical protein
VCIVYIHIVNRNSHYKQVDRKKKNKTGNIYIYIYVYSGSSKVEHNPFQEAVRLSICSTFELNGISRKMLCNAALMVRLSNFSG